MKAILAAAAAALAMPVLAADPAALAKAFGAREAVQQLQLSPNGENILFLKPLAGGHAAVTVVNIATSSAKTVARDADGNSHLAWCVWKTDTRIICRQNGVATTGDMLLRYSRTAAINTDGSDGKEIGYRPNGRTYGYMTSTGTLVNMLPDDPNNILMTIYELPQTTNDTNINRQRDGLSIQRVNVFDSTRRMVEQPRAAADSLDTDLQSRVRLMSTVEYTNSGRATSRLHYFTRPKDGGAWQPLADADLSAVATTEILGFDESGDYVFALVPTNGRQALYRITADGTKRSQLIYANPDVDVAGIRRIGKYGRPVAAEYVTTGTRFAFFDPAIAKLDAALGKALPNQPLVSVIDESWDGGKKLIFAGSDLDPGRYYLYDVKTRNLGELLPVRPQLDGMTLGTIRTVSYPARDGTMIPAYLTMPPGKPAKNLPVIIMPHGGPSARDSWGFDWLPQFYAQLGYAVLQPNFRGSAGYGEAWFKQNGFKSWETAIGDINDGARWLAAQGIGDKARMAIVGWSYGGYAALQASVVEPDLYKATVAIAPVTDLAQLKLDFYRFSNRDLIKDFVGTGPYVNAGSPAQNAGRMKAPVLMFHGTKDINVFLKQSQMMDQALQRAGKPHQLVVYQDLDHQLNDEAARSDMLAKSAEFLAANVK